MAAARLKRQLGLFETTLYGIGVILGAGIYVLLGKTAGLAGNATWAAFVIGALIAAFTGLSYAELSSIFPKAGGEFVYTEKAFNKRIAFLVGWLIVVGGTVAAATIALGFAGYLSVLIQTPIIATAIILILLLSLINFWGIKESAIANIVSTLVEAGGLVLIIILGVRHIGSVDYTQLTPLGMPGLLGATALIFFAFLGFEEIVRLSEETRHPKRTIPKALLLSLFISTVLYILVALSAVSVVGWQTLAQSEAPLALVAQVALGAKTSLVLAVIALFATFNTVLITLIATSRMLYGMAEEGGLPKKVCAVYPRLCTPWLAIVITGVAAAAFVLVGNVQTVASVTDFALFTTFAIVNFSLLWLRHKKPNLRRPFKTWAPLAAFGAISSLAMLFYLEKPAILSGVVIVIAGLLVFEAMQRRKKWLR